MLMNRRDFLAALVISPAAAALLAACGDKSTDPVASDPATTDPTTTVPAASGFAYPTGADDVVDDLGGR